MTTGISWGLALGCWGAGALFLGVILHHLMRRLGFAPRADEWLAVATWPVILVAWLIDVVWGTQWTDRYHVLLLQLRDRWAAWQVRRILRQQRRR